MSNPIRDWMQCALHALQNEEYIARYVLYFRRSWLRDWQAHGFVPLDTLLTAQVCRAAGIEADGEDLSRKVKSAFVELMMQE